MLPGLLVAAALSLMLVIYHLSRPLVGELAREPTTGTWARADRHRDWERVTRAVVARVEGPLFYASTTSVLERLRALVRAHPQSSALVLDLAETPDLDVETPDALGELADELRRQEVELVLTSVDAPVAELLRRAGLLEKIRVQATPDAALSDHAV